MSDPRPLCTECAAVSDQGQVEFDNALPYVSLSLTKLYQIRLDLVREVLQISGKNPLHKDDG